MSTSYISSRLQRNLTGIKLGPQLGNMSRMSIQPTEQNKKISKRKYQTAISITQLT
jgi:hypothetical protein